MRCRWKWGWNRLAVRSLGPLIFEIVERLGRFGVAFVGHGTGLDAKGIVERLLRVVDVLVAAGGNDPGVFVGKWLLTAEGSPLRGVKPGTGDDRAPAAITSCCSLWLTIAS